MAGVPSNGRTLIIRKARSSFSTLAGAIPPSLAASRYEATSSDAATGSGVGADGAASSDAPAATGVGTDGAAPSDAPAAKGVGGDGAARSEVAAAWGRGACVASSDTSLAWGGGAGVAELNSSGFESEQAASNATAATNGTNKVPTTYTRRRFTICSPPTVCRPNALAGAPNSGAPCKRPATGMRFESVVLRPRTRSLDSMRAMSHGCSRSFWQEPG